MKLQTLNKVTITLAALWLVAVLGYSLYRYITTPDLINWSGAPIVTFGPLLAYAVIWAMGYCIAKIYFHYKDGSWNGRTFEQKGKAAYVNSIVLTVVLTLAFFLTVYISTKNYDAYHTAMDACRAEAMKSKIEPEKHIDFMLLCVRGKGQRVFTTKSCYDEPFPNSDSCLSHFYEPVEPQETEMLETMKQAILIQNAEDALRKELPPDAPRGSGEELAPTYKPDEDGEDPLDKWAREQEERLKKYGSEAAARKGEHKLFPEALTDCKKFMADTYGSEDSFAEKLMDMRACMFRKGYKDNFTWVRPEICDKNMDLDDQGLPQTMSLPECYVPIEIKEQVF